MAEHFHFDPVSGIRETWEYDEADGTAIIHREEDVEAVLRASAEARATGSADKLWKRDMPTRYATIPNTVAAELLKKGIDVFNLGKTQDSPEFRRFAQEIETNYPMLKATDKKAFRA